MRHRVEVENPDHVRPRGVHRIEQVHHRPGGDTDVVVSYRADQTGAEKSYTGYRHGGDGWRRLNAGWSRLDHATQKIATVQGYAVLTDPELIGLLNLALDAIPDPDAAYKADLEDDANGVTH